MKKILLSLVIWFVWLISFSDAWRIAPQSANLFWNNTLNANAWYCYMIWSNQGCIDFVENWITSNLPSNVYIYCFTDNWTVVNTCSSIVNYTLYDLSNIVWSSYTSEQCQQEYSLMPIDSCNSEYCELNWLCEVIWWSWSSTLYINDVRHESAPFIYVNIPEEFKRDYLTWEQEFTINVEWLNWDQDYINWIIDVNSYRPTSEDFTQTFVWWLTLIFPYIIITAVILFIRRFIRKIFK